MTCFHPRLSWAILSSCFHVRPFFLNSCSVLLLQVFLGRPLPRFGAIEQHGFNVGVEDFKLRLEGYKHSSLYIILLNLKLLCILSPQRMLLRVCISPDNIRRVKLPCFPESVDHLKDVLREMLELKEDFVLQFEGPEFDNSLCNLNSIEELPADKAVLKVVWHKMTSNATQMPMTDLSNTNSNSSFETASISSHTEFSNPLPKSEKHQRFDRTIWNSNIPPWCWASSKKSQWQLQADQNPLWPPKRHEISHLYFDSPIHFWIKLLPRKVRDEGCCCCTFRKIPMPVPGV